MIPEIFSASFKTCIIVRHRNISSIERDVQEIIFSDSFHENATLTVADIENRSTYNYKRKSSSVTPKIFSTIKEMRNSLRNEKFSLVVDVCHSLQSGLICRFSGAGKAVGLGAGPLLKIFYNEIVDPTDLLSIGNYLKSKIFTAPGYSNKECDFMNNPYLTGKESLKNEPEALTNDENAPLIILCPGKDRKNYWDNFVIATKEAFKRNSYLAIYLENEKHLKEFTEVFFIMGRKSDLDKNAQLLISTNKEESRIALDKSLLIITSSENDLMGQNKEKSVSVKSLTISKG